MTRPTTAEVVKLLRQMAKICDVHSNPTIRELARESADVTYALEAASAEPFEAKVERAARAVYEANKKPKDQPWESSVMESSRAWLCKTERIALRAAGLSESV